MTNKDDQEDLLWERRGLVLGSSFRVTGPTDTEARGNWGRVVEAESLVPDATGDHKQVALKIMRARHVHRAEVYKMFMREARILDCFGIEVSATRLLATGMAQLPTSTDTPARLEMAPNIESFTAGLLTAQENNWRPMLVLEPVPFEHTILYRLRQLRSHHRPHLNAILPLWEAITVTIQALELLDKCHQQQLYFIDHKPEHVIWHDDQVRFLDWNGGEWLLNKDAGSIPLGLVQTDVMNFVGYVAFPIFTGVQLDGEPVRPLTWGSVHPPPPTTLSDGDMLSFYEANTWLDRDLKKILSRPFWPAQARFPSAKAMASELQEYLDKWTIEGLFDRLVNVLNEVESAQKSLRRAQAQMNRLCRLTERPKYAELPITTEVNRTRKHLQTFINQQVLTTEEEH